MGSFCCPDREFVANSDLDNGVLFTIVEYPKGNRLEMFCEYANLNSFRKLKEISPNTAKEQFEFYKTEISKMLDFLSKNKEIGLNKLTVYKIYISGIKEVDPIKTKEACKIDFYLNAECVRHNNNDYKEIMKYKYNWRQKNLFGSGDPKQEVSFVDSNNNNLTER